jgi:hypothetical protein
MTLLGTEQPVMSLNCSGHFSLPLKEIQSACQLVSRFMNNLMHHSVPIAPVAIRTSQHSHYEYSNFCRNNLKFRKYLVSTFIKSKTDTYFVI